MIILSLFVYKLERVWATQALMMALLPKQLWSEYVHLGEKIPARQSGQFSNYWPDWLQNPQKA